jgi:predicted molibdopterin-dependent oxidoreductase YjgC
MPRIDVSTSLLPAADRGRQVHFQVDGREIAAYEGETVAAALLAAGVRAFRYSPKKHAPRGLYCGIGLCYECLVTVDGRPAVRACQTAVANGMVVETGAFASGQEPGR